MLLLPPKELLKINFQKIRSSKSYRPVYYYTPI